MELDPLMIVLNLIEKKIEVTRKMERMVSVFAVWSITYSETS